MGQLFQCCGQRPIPARTGQPRISRQKRLRCRAYPRSHGATLTSSSTPTRIRGLSPLARGNRKWRPRGPSAKGPIPARTGQPPEADLNNNWKRAYPRSHGATADILGPGFKADGLSPLARGNLKDFIFDLWDAGPIPARTGQPIDSGRNDAVFWPIPARTGQPVVIASHLADSGAYPRSHGATR